MARTNTLGYYKNLLIAVLVRFVTLTPVANVINVIKLFLSVISESVCKTRPEKIARDRNSKLLPKSVNFYNIGPSHFFI